jgi:hypothetical protein
MRALPAAGSSPVTLGVVVTDLTETRRTEELLRSLAQRVVQGHETERGRVALDLHDHVTQLLCANLFRCQALVEELTVRGGPSLKAAIRMRVMLGQTAGEVERISQQLRPGVLDLLGLEAVLRSTGREFEERSGLTLNLTVVPLSGRLPAGAGLAFYRMFEEALRNVEHHARARQVSVDLREEGGGGAADDPGRRPGVRPGAAAGAAPGQTGARVARNARARGGPWAARSPCPPDAGSARRSWYLFPYYRPSLPHRPPSGAAHPSSPGKDDAHPPGRAAQDLLVNGGRLGCGHDVGEQVPQAQLSGGEEAEAGAAVARPGSRSSKHGLH